MMEEAEHIGHHGMEKDEDAKQSQIEAPASRRTQRTALDSAQSEEPTTGNVTSEEVFEENVAHGIPAHAIGEEGSFMVLYEESNDRHIIFDVHVGHERTVANTKDNGAVLNEVVIQGAAGASLSSGGQHSKLNSANVGFELPEETERSLSNAEVKIGYDACDHFHEHSHDTECVSEEVTLGSSKSDNRQNKEMENLWPNAKIKCISVCPKDHIGLSDESGDIDTNNHQPNADPTSCRQPNVGPTIQSRQVGDQTDNKVFQCDTCDKTFKSNYARNRHCKLHKSKSRNVCKVCGMAFQQKIYLNQHIYATHKVKGELLGCNHCKRTFLTRGGLTSHLRASHGFKVPKKTWKCVNCGNHFATSQSLSRHQITHQETLSFTCRVCRKCFRRQDSLSLHMNTVHADQHEVMACDQCDQTFINRFSLISHRRVYHCTKNTFRCMKCGKRFGAKYQVRSHLLSCGRDKQDIGTSSRGLKTLSSTLCDICGKAFSRPSGLNEHIKYVHNKDKYHKCMMCPKRFARLKQLTHHVEVRHNNAHPYRCGQCGKEFISQAQLDRHDRVHQERTYTCNICPNKTFVNQSVLTTHNKEFHSSHRVIHKCEICSRCFSRKCHLESHMAKHDRNNPYDCLDCFDKFPTLESLAVHMSTFHAKSNPFGCSLCPGNFSGPGELRRHILQHTEEKPYHCTICDKYFTRQSRLKEHVLIHLNRRAYQCSQCDKAYMVKRRLTSHMQQVHTGEQRRVCEICGKEFRNISHLKFHMVVHTKERNYSCDICEQRFGTLKGLQNHKIVHSGVKPFQCTICGKAFARKASLSNHITMHQDERPHECDVCGKTYKRRDVLKIHKRIHTGELPFHCTVCNRRFNGSSDFKRHCSKHHSFIPPPGVSEYSEDIVTSTVQVEFLTH